MDLAIDTRHDLGRRPTAERLAGFGLSPVTDIAAQQSLIRQRSAGQIVIAHGNLVAVFGRWWPYLGSQLRAAWDRRNRLATIKYSGGHSAHSQPANDPSIVGSNSVNGFESDRCELFFHTPWSARQFLTLSYIHSNPRTSIASVYAAMLVLDEIARIKGSLAIVTNVTNDKVSDRLLKRWGWDRHCLNWNGRHFIKRFYGEYANTPLGWRSRLRM